MDDDCLTTGVAFPGGIPCEMQLDEDTAATDFVEGVATGPTVCPSITPIVSSTPGSPTRITTMNPHGLSSGDPVAIGGHTSTPDVDGPYNSLLGNPITVIGLTTFTIPVVTTVGGSGGVVGCNILIDAAASFDASLIDRGVTIIAGPGAGSISIIAAVPNSTTLINFYPWPGAVGIGSEYVIPIADLQPIDLATVEIPQPEFSIASGLTGVDSGPGITNGTAVGHLVYQVTIDVGVPSCNVFVPGWDYAQDAALPDYITGVNASALTANGMPDEGPNGDGITTLDLSNPFVWPRQLESDPDVSALNADPNQKLIGRATSFIGALQVPVNVLLFDDGIKYSHVTIYDDPTAPSPPNPTCSPLIVSHTYAGEVVDGDGDFDGLILGAGDPPSGTGNTITLRQCNVSSAPGTHDIDAVFVNNDTSETVVVTDTVSCGYSCVEPSPPWSVPPGDEDCDGWSSTDEGVIGTYPTDACPATGVVSHGAGYENDEDPDAWPADMNDDQVVNLSDILFLAPPVFFSIGPSPPYDVRLDLNLDNVINLSDILYLAPPVFFSTCTP